jgi:DNA helicase II / ATP-dependent DNA helicase PcrA
MQLITDLHIHSHYSRATSPQTTLENLYKWGKIKGINIIGTGDFTHPLWFKELSQKLEPAEPGLYKLKDTKNIDTEIPTSCSSNILRFIPTVEISNIYSKAGKIRKIHNIIITPLLESAAKINSYLNKIGNLAADGRPILNLDSKELLRITLETDPSNLFIPAHIWTPWFGMFGSKSGFDSIQETFEDLSPHIHATETGLSSDPYMNWRISELQNRSIVSFSDAHSPPKLGREATIINAELNYTDIIAALKTNDHRLVGTIEFFPQEGKYHYDGHRKCNIRFTPAETKQHHGICPICHKPLTVGVNYRVNELANHPENSKSNNDKLVEYILPLPEILAELQGVKSVTKKVEAEYFKTITALGDEFSILRNIEINEIKNQGFPQLAQAIHKLRQHEIHIDPGYDGVYGKISIV